VLASSNLLSFQLVSELADRIVEDRSVFHVRVCEAIAEQDKRVIEDRLTNSSECPHVMEYISLFGVDYRQKQYKLIEVALQKRRDLPGVNFNLLQSMLDKFCKELSFDCIQTEKRLAEGDRAELRQFLEQECSHLGFRRAWRTIKAVDRASCLLAKIEELFRAVHPEIKPVDARNLTILQRAVRDFLFVDDHVT